MLFSCDNKKCRARIRKNNLVCLLVFFYLVLVCMMILQNLDGGLYLKNTSDSNGTFEMSLSLWTYCVFSKGGSPIKLESVPLSFKHEVGTAVCIEFDVDLKDAQGQQVVGDFGLLVFGRVLSLFAILFLVIALLYLEDNTTFCGLLFALSCILELVLLVIVSVYWGRYNYKYSLGEPWLAVYLAGGIILLVVLTLLYANPERLHGKKNVPSKITVQRVVELDRDKESYESWGTKMNNDDDSDSYSDSDSSESTKKTTNNRNKNVEPKKEQGDHLDAESREGRDQAEMRKLRRDPTNCCRDVHLGLYTVSLILQVITHGHRGASSTTRQQWVSLWRYCLGEHTQVTWGGGQGSNDFMESQGLCMAIGYSMPKGIVQSTLIFFSMVALMVSHLLTIVGIGIAFYLIYNRPYRHRKCLTYGRLVVVMTLFVILGASCMLYTLAIPDGFEIDYAFISGWGALLLIFIVLIFSFVQVVCKPNLFGEMPEADDENYTIRLHVPSQPNKNNQSANNNNNNHNNNNNTSQQALRDDPPNPNEKAVGWRNSLSQVQEIRSEPEKKQQKKKSETKANKSLGDVKTIFPPEKRDSNKRRSTKSKSRKSNPTSPEQNGKQQSSDLKTPGNDLGVDSNSKNEMSTFDPNDTGIQSKTGRRSESKRRSTKRSSGNRSKVDSENRNNSNALGVEGSEQDITGTVSPPQNNYDNTEMSNVDL